MTDKTGKWSWGGAMFPIIYLVLSGRLIAAILLTIGMMIPLFNLLLLVILFIVGGLKGRERLATDSSLTPALVDTYSTFFERVGKFFFWIVLLFVCIWIFIGIFLGGTVEWMMDLQGMSQQGMEFMNMMDSYEGIENVDMGAITDLEGLMAELENIESMTE